MYNPQVYIKINQKLSIKFKPKNKSHNITTILNTIFYEKIDVESQLIVIMD